MQATRITRANDVGQCEVHLPEQAAEQRADQHPAASCDLPPSKHPILGLVPPAVVECIDQPGVDRSMNVGSQDPVEPRRQGTPTNPSPAEGPARTAGVESGQRHHRDDRGDSPADRVGDNSGGHLEDHLGNGEHTVHRHGAKQIETADANQEDGVDRPDERGAEGEQAAKCQIGEDDWACGVLASVRRITTRIPRSSGPLTARSPPRRETRRLVARHHHRVQRHLRVQFAHVPVVHANAAV